jgi:probable rRNA maturation factor
LPLQKLRAAVRAVLIREQVEAAKVEITLVDDETIAQLNSAYLGHEGPTDVLTFDLTERRPERRRRRTTVHRFLEGHIITSVETAVREAKRRGLPWPAELCLYLVHGVLHLVGYQDDTAESAKRMHVQEDEILRALGWGPVFAAEPR